MPENTKKSRRGGARLNTGPKPVLDELGRWAVGAFCEGLYRRYQCAHQSQMVRELQLPARLADARTQIEARALNLHWSRARTAEELSKAGEAIFGRRSRLYRIPPSRPYGRVRLTVIKACRRYYWARHRISLSERNVDACWKKFRALDRYVRDALPDLTRPCTSDI